MTRDTRDERGTNRRSESRGAIDMPAAEFRAIGHALVDRIAEFYESLPSRPVTAGESARSIRALLGARALPQEGQPAEALLRATATLLFEHSLHNGHPRFFGYITSSAAPLGALADLLAAAVNSNVSLWDISPVASEIEAQTIEWLADLVGFGSPCGGLMVSGGNMANVVAFVAARRARAPWDIRTLGTYGDSRRFVAYASRETHTWIQKAADLTGLGTEAIRWIDTDSEQRLDVAALRRQLDIDVGSGRLPFFVVGTAGTVSTGAVDPLPAIHEVAQHYGLWFHVDGAYGAPAAALPEASAELRALGLADSLALDPHKWLYSPIEAACVIVRERARLLDAFSYRPPYYQIVESDEPGNDYYELGLQNTRGFRALKVWLGLQHLGRNGHCELIRRNVALAAELFRAAAAQDDIEACTCSLSIATFRFAPRELRAVRSEEVEGYLNELNAVLLERLKTGGEAYLSNAVIAGKYMLRACIVNFRTTSADVAAIPAIVARVGRAVDGELRPTALRR